MLAVGSLCISLLAGPAAEAPHVPLPPVNLGGSSFMDGVAGPGGFARAFVTASSASRFHDAHGRPRPGAHSLSTLVVFAHTGVLLPRKLLGAHWGADLLVPVVRVSATHDGATTGAAGLGDLIVSPLILQWPAARVDSRSVFSSRLSLSLILPTGAYNPSAAGTGSNVFSINPYYAFTVQLTDRLETSWRIHYLWNSPNHRPAAALAAERVQPGQAIHANGAISYALSPHIRLGLAGYFVAQTTRARIDGQPVPHDRERVVGLGPGIRLSLGSFNLTLNAFWEFAAVSRPAGFRAGLSLVKLWSL